MSRLFLLPMLVIAIVDGAKILVYPYDAGFNSRLMNLVKIADILNNNGHNATVLINSKIVNWVHPQNTNLTVYHLAEAEKVQLITDEVVIQRFKDLSFFNAHDFVKFFIELGMPFCKGVLGTEMKDRLKAEQYDLVITDTMSDCGRVLIDYLDKPAMTYNNWGFHTDPKIFYPYIPSFMCNAGLTTCFSDEMSFFERVGNMLQYLVSIHVMLPTIVTRYDALKEELGLNTSRSMAQSLAYRAPVLVNGDFILDYPRPLMPHIIMVRGLFHNKPKLLPADLAEFVQGSIPHGLVVVSFGSLLSKVDLEKAEIMAKVFGRLQQRVLWRYTGELPKALKNNTKLVGWFPQADVLASPHTAMFITHGGISGTYEAALNSLPVVVIPFFADQEYNARKMVERGGMGVKYNFDDLKEDTFEEAVLAAIYNSTYRENAKRVSSLLKDQEMDPQKRFLYWVDYVIRHNGARYLISETALSMNYLTYQSIDVILFILGVSVSLIVLITGLLYITFRFCRRIIGSSNKQKTQ